jgi:hypothetical protein
VLRAPAAAHTARARRLSINLLHEYVNPKNNTKAPLIAEDVYAAVIENAAVLDAAMEYSRDYDYDYFGFKARRARRAARRARASVRF